eukprot:CAMPEP_0194272462 /NCGR_PEP_ID=MMETSP0169-20130528/6029_1 /TAXON_ID=218684 /ORGANISM="Corethron pennatum, Strain L29A3" /LENGTH=385 /DNA_ID=CAMNT_0039015133 /DNA_START=72 /DNA_END=1229 /DNA_ORIENTATION=-
MSGWSFSFGPGGYGGQGGGHGGGMGGYPAQQRFEEQYHCYSVAHADKAHLEGGDKILLPPSAFDTLARMSVEYPMLFRLESPHHGTATHCGVLEFTAKEGYCNIPFWMMQNLLIEEGSVLTCTNVSLPKATLIKLRPQHVDFLEISNPRAVLEHALRSYSCVTKGDVICLPYNNKNYHLELKEVQPQDAACIIETDCNVEFDAPVGYVEPGSQEAKEKEAKQYANMPRRSADGKMSSATSGGEASAEADTEEKKCPRIVNGEVLPKEDEGLKIDAKMMASKIGATGVQRNSAVPVTAPTVDYWAADAGNGARLDGKKPAKLLDANGNVVDEREIRAKAAEARAAAAGGSKEAKPVVPTRKSRIGNKFSSRRGAGGFAFGGEGNKM